MNISANRLKQIIVEEYVKEEGILQELTDEQKEEMLAWIRGTGPRPEWATDDLGTSAAAKRRKNKAVQAPAGASDRAAETMPLPPRLSPDEEDDAPPGVPSSEVHPIKATIDGIYELVSDMDPEDVQEIFQIVFEKLPGVELEPAPQNPGTLYTPGSEGRPTVGFREIKQLIRKVLTEGHYHDMGGEDEMYNAFDPHGLEDMSDAELIDMMHKDGMEELIVADGEGGLINREEVIAALKDV